MNNCELNTLTDKVDKNADINKILLTFILHFSSVLDQYFTSLAQAACGLTCKAQAENR